MDTKNHQKIKPQKKRFEAPKNGFLEAKDRPRGRQGGLIIWAPIYIYGHSWLPPPEPPSLSSSKLGDGLKALLQAALRSYLPRFPPYMKKGN